MVRNDETVIYGPQTRDDIPPVVQRADQPLVVIQGYQDGSWWYRWWDQGAAYLTGSPPTRDKHLRVMSAVLPALLADYARVGGQQPPEQQAT